MNNTSRIQVVNNKQHKLYHQLQDLIYNQCGVHCSVRVKHDLISIRTKDYTDYVMAKSVIKGRVTQQICRDVFGEKEASEQSTI